MQITPKTSRAAVLDHFGAVETIQIRQLPIPTIGPDDVLIQVDTAGIAAWDAEERAGDYAGAFGEPQFPYVLGWDGAGVVVAVGEQVNNIQIGMKAYTAVVPKQNGGGFYSQYAVAAAEYVWPIPERLTIEQAGVMGWDVLTALTGVDDVLSVMPGESLMVFGASGGIGHMAIQLAKRLGARVLAVASGEDGVALASRLGADAVINGRQQDVLAAARAFAPNGLDAALFTAGGEVALRTLETVREGGRIAYPNGIRFEPPPQSGLRIHNYDASRAPATIAKLHRLIDAGPFEIHVARTFTLDQIADAHRTLATHFLGKLALRPNP